MTEPLVSEFVAACAAVEIWFDGEGWPWRQLTVGELQSYAPRMILAGWRLEVTFSDCKRRLDVLTEAGFPWRPPLIALVDRPPHLTWPHVELDGVVCILPGAAEIDAAAPVDALCHLLGEAVELIEPAGRELDGEAFRREFNSYWPVDDEALPTLSLLRPAGPTRRIAVWRGQHMTLVGDEPTAMARWLAHRNGDTALKPSFEHGVLLWREKALLPAEYPNTGADVRGLAAKCAGGDLLDRLVRLLPSSFVVVIGAATINGPALASVVIGQPAEISRGPHRRAVASLGKGFRKGHLPDDQVRAAYLGGGRVLRARVERVDAGWVHGRDREPRLPRLRTARVALIGCGSVGGALAIQLSRAGVGHLILIDPDRLSWANIGRHELGAISVGLGKAEQLAIAIRQQLPHIESIDVHAKRWEQVAREDPDVLKNADLIVSTTGSGSAELALNAWHLAQGRTMPIVYGWTEPHACAGQVIVVGSTGACFSCCVDRFGAARLPVTEWPADMKLLQEPACGAVFQPYGPIELQNIVTMIGETVLERLLSPERTEHEYRVWTARRELLAAAGGRWSEAWEQRTGAGHAGGSMVPVALARAPDCATCGQRG